LDRGELIEDYKDQTDVFYASPIAYLRNRFPSTVDPRFPPSPRPLTSPRESLETSYLQHDWRHEWPEYLIMFGALLQEPGVEVLLRDAGYIEVWKEEHGWEGDERRRGGVVALKAG
jgi:GPI mannosyltransferase 3